MGRPKAALLLTDLHLVYDVTLFMDDHPGGDEVLLAATGKELDPISFRRKDATTDFEDVGHSDDAKTLMEKYYIGEIDVSTLPAKQNYAPSKIAAFNPDKSSELLTKILQFLVPLMILGLAFAVRHFTKSTNLELLNGSADGNAGILVAQELEYEGYIKGVLLSSNQIDGPGLK
ncbi:Cytochrome b5 isoform E [Asimina triloba]